MDLKFLKNMHIMLFRQLCIFVFCKVKCNGVKSITMVTQDLLSPVMPQILLILLTECILAVEN